MGPYDKKTLERIIERGSYTEKTLAMELLKVLPPKTKPFVAPPKGPPCGHEQREVIQGFPCPFPGCESGTYSKEVYRAVRGVDEAKKYRRVKYRHTSDLALASGHDFDLWAWELVAD